MVRVGGGRNAINYTEVLTLNQEVFHGTTITEEMLTMMPIDKENINKAYLMSAEQIIGKEAIHYIPAATPLVIEYFDDANVVLNEGQVIAQIPSSWITSMPQTLRRNDKIFLYATDIPVDRNEEQEQGQYQTATSNEETTNVEEDAAADNSTESLEDDELGEMIELYETHVAYVKDGSNNEVLSVSSGNRKNASSTVSSVEIVTTADDFKEIEKKINEGSFLIIMYSDAHEIEETENLEEEGEE